MLVLQTSLLRTWRDSVPLKMHPSDVPISHVVRLLRARMRKTDRLTDATHALPIDPMNNRTNPALIADRFLTLAAAHRAGRANESGVRRHHPHPNRLLLTHLPPASPQPKATKVSVHEEFL